MTTFARRSDPPTPPNKQSTDCRSHMAAEILSGLIWLELWAINDIGTLVYVAAHPARRPYVMASLHDLTHKNTQPKDDCPRKERQLAEDG